MAKHSTENRDPLADLKLAATTALTLGLLAAPPPAGADGWSIYGSTGPGPNQPGQGGPPGTMSPWNYPYYYNGTPQNSGSLALPRAEPFNPTIHFNLPPVNETARQFSVSVWPRSIEFHPVESEVWGNARLPERPGITSGLRYLTLEAPRYPMDATPARMDVSREDFAQAIGQAFKNLLSEPVINSRLRELSPVAAKYLFDHPTKGVLVRVNKYLDYLGDSVAFPDGIYIEAFGDQPGEAYVLNKEREERYGTIGAEKPALFLSPDTYWIWVTNDPTNLDTGVMIETYDWVEMAFQAGFFEKSRTK